jgi:tetratricopeptide (TPR) repeat protein
VAPRDYTVCPACGARNKPKWEFCVRCGEPIEAQTVVMGAGGSAGSSADDVDEYVADEGSGAWRGVLLFVLAVGGAGALAWWLRPSAAGPPTDPGLFTMPTTPQALPSVASTLPDRAALAYAQGLQKLSAGDHRGAALLFGEAASLEPGNAIYAQRYGEALWNAGEREDALRALEQSARLSTSNRLAYARALHVVGRRDQAVQEYRELLELAPNPALAQDLGHLLYEQGKFSEALGFLKTAADAQPDDPVLHGEYGHALEQTGNRTAAKAVYSDIIDRFPRAPAARGRMAEILLQEGNTADAVRVVQAGIQVDPSLPMPHRNLGSVLERVGRLADAAKAYREYARLAPNAPDAQQMLARASALEARASSSS